MSESVPVTSVVSKKTPTTTPATATAVNTRERSRAARSSEGANSVIAITAANVAATAGERHSKKSHARSAM
jgi:hypothetical protein